MKRLTLICVVFINSFLQAQSWVEDFNSTAGHSIPAGWTQYNGDHLGVWPFDSYSSHFTISDGWITEPFNTLHGKCAISNCSSNGAPTGSHVNDWLITPSFTVPVNSIFTWEAIAPDHWNPNSYYIKISTTGADTSHFTTTLLYVPTENTSWTKRTLSLNTYSNQVVNIAFVNRSSAELDNLWLDNIEVPNQFDIKIDSISPQNKDSWGAIGSTKTISGRVVNNGYDNVTSFTAKYTDGTTTVSNVFSGLSLSYNQSYNFSFSMPYTITTSNEKNIKVWVELPSDSKHNNDTLNEFITGYSFTPNHKITFEESTGTWCGFCVRGTVFMDSMYHVHPSTTVLIAPHSGDIMTLKPYDDSLSLINKWGWPATFCDRTMNVGGMSYMLDPSEMFTEYGMHINEFGVADLIINPTYNSSTREAQIIINTHFASSFINNNSNRNFRLAVVFTEDKVKGVTTDYDQHNYYSGGAHGPLVGAGHNFVTEPDPILAANMEYDFVAREIVGGYRGKANSLPNIITASSTYTSSVFSYTVPATYDVNNMNVNALLIDAKNNIIYNANSAKLNTSSVSIKEISENVIDINLYPNPATNQTTLKINIIENSNATITVLNTIGEVVYQSNQKLSKGLNSIDIVAKYFVSGMYNVIVNTNNGIVNKKLVINK